MIDILDAYYKEFDGPLQKAYNKKVIPLAVELYKRSDNEEIIKLNTQVRFLKMCSSCKLKNSP